MAKVANVKAEVQANAETTVHAGVKIVDGHEMPLDAVTVRLLIEGWRIKQAVDDMKKRLDEINAQLIEAHGTGCALVATGVCRASLAERESVRIADAERLKAVLGDRFADLVKTEVAYKPEKRLIEMACDADDPMQPSIGACLTIGKSQAVNWRSER